MGNKIIYPAWWQCWLWWRLADSCWWQQLALVVIRKEEEPASTMYSHLIWHPVGGTMHRLELAHWGKVKHVYFCHQPKMDELADSRSWIYLWYTPFRFVLSTFLLDLFQRMSAQAGWPRVKWRIKGFLCRLSRTIVWPAPSSLNPPLKSLPPTWQKLPQSEVKYHYWLRC